MSKKVRWTLTIVFLLLQFGLIGYGIRGSIPPREVPEVSGYDAWDQEAVEIAAELPVQDGGRIKPLLTFARFKMMSFHGSLTMKVKDGETVHKIGPVEWLLDCLFRPQTADRLPVFRLDNTEILRPFKVETESRRGYISFAELEKPGDPTKPGSAFEQLLARGRVLLEKQSAEGEDSLSAEEKQTVQFAQLVLNYLGLRDSLDLLRPKLPEIDPKTLAYVDGRTYTMLKETGLDPSRFSFWLPVLSQTAQSLERLQTPEARAFQQELYRQMKFAEYGPVWIPPQEGEDEEWQSLGTKVEKFVTGELRNSVELMKDLKALEAVVDSLAVKNGQNFAKELGEWKEQIGGRAEARDEGEKVATEVTYYNRDYFTYSLTFFLIAFLVSAVGWLVREGRAGTIISWMTTVLYLGGTGYVLAGLVHRYVITGRPPVSTLYDTIPFITAGAAIVLGIAELLTRRRILLSIGAALGVIGLFFAFSFELGDAKDSMDPLRAVLDSNYWLATHVVTITIGYCGGLVACFLSIVYVHMALAGVMKDPKNFHRFMTRAVYGIVCFTLLFALVGTVLGGIWANDSWGRFWGWDPKENGALLIVLWTLIILHSRLAGWMTGWGIHIMSILGGSVVVFSWWGVNMLEVGLHSYGFTEGAEAVYYFYGATVISSLVGVAAMLIERSAKRPARAKVEKAPQGAGKPVEQL